jgi:hypothetical protein
MVLNPNTQPRFIKEGFIWTATLDHEDRGNMNGLNPPVILGTGGSNGALIESIWMDSINTSFSTDRILLFISNTTSSNDTGNTSWHLLYGQMLGDCLPLFSYNTAGTNNTVVVSMGLPPLSSPISNGVSARGLRIPADIEFGILIQEQPTPTTTPDLLANRLYVSVMGGYY